MPAGTGGSIEVYAADPTDLVIDINGYFAPMTTGGLSLYDLSPCRVVDTRGSAPFTGNLPVAVTASNCGVPVTAQAYVLGVAVLPYGGSPLGYLKLWAQGQPQPPLAAAARLDGTTTSNLAIVQSNNGSITAYATNLTHLVLDVRVFRAVTSRRPLLSR